VNPAKAQVVAQNRAGETVALYRAPGLGEDADAWWYYLESEGKPAVIDPEKCFVPGLCSIVIVALFFIVMGLYRNRHPKDEKGRKQRRNFILGVVCVLLYAIGRIVLILNNG